MKFTWNALFTFNRLNTHYWSRDNPYATVCRLRALIYFVPYKIIIIRIDKNINALHFFQQYKIELFMSRFQKIKNEWLGIIFIIYLRIHPYQYKFRTFTVEIYDASRFPRLNKGCITLVQGVPKFSNNFITYPVYWSAMLFRVTVNKIY